jgi:hypothetical protein
MSVNSGFNGIVNTGLQGSALKSSTLVNSFDLNAIRVLNGSVASSTGIAPVLDSQGKPIFLSSTDLLVSLVYSGVGISQTATGIAEIGLADSPTGAINRVLASPAGAQSTNGFVVTSPTGAGPDSYVNFNFSWGTMGVPLDVSMIVINPL